MEHSKETFELDPEGRVGLQWWEKENAGQKGNWCDSNDLIMNSEFVSGLKAY